MIRIISGDGEMDLTWYWNSNNPDHSLKGLAVKALHVAYIVLSYGDWAVISLNLD